MQRDDHHHLEPSDTSPWLAVPLLTPWRHLHRGGASLKNTMTRLCDQQRCSNAVLDSLAAVHRTLGSNHSDLSATVTEEGRCHVHS